MNTTVVTQCLVQARQTKEGLGYVLSEAQHQPYVGGAPDRARFQVVAKGNLSHCGAMLMARANRVLVGNVSLYQSRSSTLAEYRRAWIKAFRDVRHINNEDYWHAEENRELPGMFRTPGPTSRGKFCLDRQERVPEADWRPDPDDTALLPQIGMVRYEFMPGKAYHFTRHDDGFLSRVACVSFAAGEKPKVAIKLAKDSLSKAKGESTMDAFALIDKIEEEVPERMERSAVDLERDIVFAIDLAKTNDPYSTRQLAAIQKSLPSPITLEEIERVGGEVTNDRGNPVDVMEVLFDRLAGGIEHPSQNAVEPVVARPPTSEERKQIESRRKRRESGPEPFSVSAKADARIRPVALV